MTTRRNDPCPCGSGKKYKHCCAGKGTSLSGKSSAVIGGIALVAAAGVLAISLNRREDPAPVAARPVAATMPGTTATAATQPAPGLPAPVGAPPADIAIPGRIWSEEHKHWHNATKAENPIVVETSTATTPKVVSIPKPENSQVIHHPQPPGPVPAGKIWSPLHGHWHDAAAQTLPTPAGPQVMDVPQPPGPAPEGKVWSREHGHWHSLAPRTGTTASAPPRVKDVPPPPGPAPAGKVWSREHGHWHNAPTPTQ